MKWNAEAATNEAWFVLVAPVVADGGSAPFWLLAFRARISIERRVAAAGHDAAPPVRAALRRSLLLRSCWRPLHVIM